MEIRSLAHGKTESAMIRRLNEILHDAELGGRVEYDQLVHLYRELDRVLWNWKMTQMDRQGKGRW